MKYSYVPIQNNEAKDYLRTLLEDREMLCYMDLPYWEHKDELAELLYKCNSGGASLYIMVQEAKVVGIIGLSSINVKHRYAYSTIGIVKQYRNTCASTEAILMVEKIAFEVLMLNRIEAQVHEKNISAQAFLKKHNYTQEGIMRSNFIIENEVSNSVLFSKIKSD